MSYADYVDTVLLHAKRLYDSRAHRAGVERRYDTAYYAQMLWRAQAFLEYAKSLPKKAALRRKIRECAEDFLAGVYEGEPGEVRAELREMAHLAAKLRKILGSRAPDIAPLEANAIEYPTPKLLRN